MCSASWRELSEANNQIAAYWHAQFIAYGAHSTTCTNEIRRGAMKCTCGFREVSHTALRARFAALLDRPDTERSEAEGRAETEPPVPTMARAMVKARPGGTMSHCLTCGAFRNTATIAGVLSCLTCGAPIDELAPVNCTAFNNTSGPVNATQLPTPAIDADGFFRS